MTNSTQRATAPAYKRSHGRCPCRQPGPQGDYAKTKRRAERQKKRDQGKCDQGINGRLLRSNYNGKQGSDFSFWSTMDVYRWANGPIKRGLDSLDEAGRDLEIYHN